MPRCRPYCFLADPARMPIQDPSCTAAQNATFAVIFMSQVWLFVPPLNIWAVTNNATFTRLFSTSLTSSAILLVFSTNADYTLLDMAMYLSHCGISITITPKTVYVTQPYLHRRNSPRALSTMHLLIYDLCTTFFELHLTRLCCGVWTFF